LGNRPDDPQDIVRLISQVITVSLETVKIVKVLLPLSVAAGYPPSEKVGILTRQCAGDAHQASLRQGMAVPVPEVGPAAFGLPGGPRLARISHDRIEQRSGESVRRLDITQPNDNATRRFFCDRL
jgi:hypothetical protein